MHPGNVDGTVARGRACRIRGWHLAMLAVIGVVAGGRAGLGATKDVDFTRDIRPILSENCFTCHGPDEKQRKGKYRVDTRDGAFTRRDGTPAIVPGKASESEFFKRLVTTDADELMPPGKTGKKLSETQLGLLRRWVDAGANWNEHWAFVPVRRPEEPAVKGAPRVRNAIDRFVEARLEKEGLEPGPEAERPELLRRASLDITGLPPTPEELDAFLADGSSEAYEKVVDRLLKSPRYGEHMARQWLDAVRYADTHGYHIDSQRDIWPYRDWVLSAFNKNQPFDQFTTEQLAGDLLPNPTTEQRVATGFVRCNMSTGEGGVIEAEYAAKYAFDRVETLGTVYLGATLICSRCHSHKYDPYPAGEYYGIYSMFNNLAEPVMDGNKPNPDPFLKLPTPEQTARLGELAKRTEDVQRKISAPDAELDAAQSAWADRMHLRFSEQLSLLRPVSGEIRVTEGRALEARDDGTISAGVAGASTSLSEVTWRLAAGPLSALRLEFLAADKAPAAAGRFGLSEIEVDLMSGPEGKATPRRLKVVRAHAAAEDPGHEAGRVLDGKADTAWAPPAGVANTRQTLVLVLGETVEVPEDAQLRLRLRQEVPALQGALPRLRLAAARQAGLTDLLFPPKPSPWRMIGPFPVSDPKEALTAAHPAEKDLASGTAYPGVRGEVRWADVPEIEFGRTHTLVHEIHGVHGVRYLARRVASASARAAELRLRTEGWYRLWVNGECVAEKADATAASEGPRSIPIQLKAGANEILVKVVSVNDAVTFLCDLDSGTDVPTPPAVTGALLAGIEFHGAEADQVRDFFRRTRSTEHRKLQDELASMREENARIERSIVTTLVAKELPQPRDTYFLTRGEYDKPAHKVVPTVFSSILPFPAGAPSNRLGLARWLVDPKHPLTSRVIVNRYWQNFFGNGLVRTSDDFGSQGDRPSHPELLDWMAAEFVASGWDVKHMMRLIATSATYRRSSRCAPEMQARDPENRLFARGPRHRLDAELIRDLALVAGGLLRSRIGGPSAKPYEPAGLWEAVSYNNAQRYVQDVGDGNYRRSLYTFWKRQSPPPSMLTFDAPTRETCTVRRPRTNTPMQALATLNDPQFVEAARAFAARILQCGGGVEDRLRWAFRVATARVPEDAEVASLRRLWERQLAGFRAEPARAEAYLAVGTFRPDTAADRCELAAWSAVANVLLNLDETITKG